MKIYQLAWNIQHSGVKEAANRNFSELKLGKQEERGKTTEVSPWQEEV